MTMSTKRTPRLADVALPDFGVAVERPDLDPALYPARVARLRERMERERYTHLVVYADREHSANLSYLTGFDPRFEEAVLIVGRAGEPAILVGNECWGMAGAAPLPMRRHRFQDLSLPSQPRDRSRPLREILGDEGIGPARRVGVIGWKAYADRATMEVPSFLVEALRALTGPGGLVENAADLLIGPADGLRAINEVDQLAAMEAAACVTSSGVRGLLTGLEPGLTEREAVRLLGWDGSPLSCHLMLTAGPRARLGLLSPGDRPIERGDPFTVAFGIWGALDCRAGFVVEDAAELPEAIADYTDRLVAPYFAAVVEWYEALHVGPDRWHAPGHHRPAPGRPILRDLPEPGPPDPIGRVAQLADLPGLDHRTRVRDGPPVRHHPRDRNAVLHDQHRGRPGACRRVAARSRSPAASRRPGSGSRPAGGSCASRSGSSCTRTSCRSPTSRATCRRSCCDRIGS